MDVYIASPDNPIENDNDEPQMKLFVRAINVEFPKKRSSASEAVIEGWSHLCGSSGWHNGWGRDHGSIRNKDGFFDELPLSEKVKSIVKDFRIRQEGNGIYLIYDRFSGGLFTANSKAVETVNRIKSDRSEQRDMDHVSNLLSQFYYI